MTQSKDFDEWGLVEVMGHSRFAGRIMEQTIGGASFIRVDVPKVGDNQSFSKIFGATSIYAITPTTEEVARRLALNIGNVPINRYELKLDQGMMSQRTLVCESDEDEDEDDWHR